jgi:GTP pyrophosphokinase
MPAGCTALDFAFQIHTFLGSHCIGAKVNHKLVPLSHKLQSGDQVEILTSKGQHVQPSWINFVSTAKAKGKILAILRHDNRETQKNGEAILNEWLKKNDFELTTSIIDKLCDFHKLQKPESFFQALGDKTIILDEKDLDELQGKSKTTNTENKGWRRYVPFLGKDKKKDKVQEQILPMVVDQNFNKKKPVIINEENINLFVFPDCCHPIPGDDILGYIDNQNHIEIHKRSCPVAAKLKSSFGNRIVDAKWDMHKHLFFYATIEIQGIDRKGLLLDAAKVISGQLDVNIHQLTINSDKGLFDGKIELRVHDREDVKMIMDNLKAIEGLQEIQQIL